MVDRAACSRREALRKVLAAGGALVLGGCRPPAERAGGLDRQTARPSASTASAAPALQDNRAPATFHVDPARGDDGNSGTAPGAAWRTLEKLTAEVVAGVIAPGDAVAFAPGSTFRRHEATDGKLWFENGIHYTCPDAGNRPLFEGSGDRPFGIRGQGTRIENLRFSGGIRSVLHTDGTAPVDVALDNVDCENGQGIGFQQLSGEGAAAGSAFRILGGSFSNNGTIGINLSGARDTTVDAATASGNGTVGIRLRSTGPGCVIRNCTASGNGSNGIGIDTSGERGGSEIVERNDVFGNATVQDDTSGIKTFSRGTVLRYNRVYDNGVNGTVNHGIQLEVGSRDCRCIGNLSYGNLTAGISFTGTGHRIHHNTCHANGDAGIATFSASVASSEVKNNLLSGNGSWSFRSHGSVALEAFVLDFNLHEGSAGPATVRYAGVDYRSLAALRADTGQELHGVEGDSRLDPAELRVPGGSAAAAAGDARVGVTHDFAGNRYGRPPTIGAFETTPRP